MAATGYRAPQEEDSDTDDVFVSSDDMAVSSQFLHELPSYQSMLRRKPSVYGTRERLQSNSRQIRASVRADPSILEFVQDDIQVHLRDYIATIQEKRVIRNRRISASQYDTEWNKWKENRWKSWKRCIEKIGAVASSMQLWRHDIHSIEGKFGTGIQSYFAFLRFLVILNVVIFILMFSFTILPIALSTEQNRSLLIPRNVDLECTVYASSGYGLLYFYNSIIDLLSGTGYLEFTYLFYGYYTVNSVSFPLFKYNLPLAYVLVTITYLLLSVFWIVKRAVRGFRQSLVHEQDRFQSYCNKIFAGWDFCITDENCARIKKSILQYELKTDLEEEKIRLRKAKRTRGEAVTIYSVRILLNIIVIAILGSCFYGIFWATVYSQENSNIGGVDVPYSTSLVTEYLPSIVITLANFITPLIFEFIVRYEDYSPAFEIKLTLIRCVFVRLASIVVLLISLWTQITSCGSQACTLCGYNHKLYPCWESRVGQEMYKLMIFDFLIISAVTLFVEFPRKLVVTYSSWKPAKWLGQQEFQIPENVLQIVYGQTICWIGTFYSPLLPAIATIKYVLVFYIKKVTLMENCKPSTRPFRASSSNFFFLIILLIGLVVACIPVGLGIAYVPSSKACGPFLSFNTSWEIIPRTINTFPNGIQKILYGAASEAFAVPFFVMICVILCYFIALVGAHKRMVEQLREQLAMEGRDKLFLY
ncbi:transmembrane channel-like protein 7 isoform X1 [Bombina bombina]|uniref:transmembrane channel-like protein 7 isoform X1 n=1 Tax=Bombina bombina TaxID=8345 RepID=UPI00235AE04E|nr:transmembrane channel-like protein 7 isoform X1 [Bombina bombina]